jgi:predicted amidohydrolase YtcJ
MPADQTLFTGGHVFDGHRLRRDWHVLIEGDRVAAVGDADRVAEHHRPGADEVDVDGGLLLPGFRDAHMHPMMGGLERLRCELFELSSPDDYLAAIQKAARERPDDPWVRGGGWSVDAFGPHGPTAEQLDRVVPDRPAFIPSADHHDAWVNTRALEIAGITASTPDPADGWIERDAEGRPTGTLREAAMHLVWDHLETTRDEYADALREAQSHLHSWGITGWHDALIGGYAGLDDPTQAYLDLLDGGELTARVRCSQWWDRSRPPEEAAEQAAELLARRDELRQQGLDAGSVKLMMDGIAETFTASVSEPYRDLHGCPCGDSGIAFLDRDHALAAVAAVDAAGLQAHFHAIGDAAVTLALDAVEHARRINGLRDLRHQIAHLQLVRPEDRPRFGELQVVANLQGMWSRRDTPAVSMIADHLDDERMSWHYPFRDLIEGRARHSGGSDWPVNPPEPIAAVHVLVNRRAWTPDDSAPPALVPEQAIRLTDALSAYTRGSAWADHHEDGGFVQVGTRADLTVLDRNLFDLPADEIGSAEVASTWARGQLVHER